MPKNNVSIGARYGLVRDNFIPDPLLDTDCFARDDVDTKQIAESLDIDLVTGLAPKRLVWGPYGGGKTHTLMRTMKELERLTTIYTVRIECPDLGRKSRFHDLYREGIMRGLGQDFVVGLLEEGVQAVGMHRREDLLPKLRDKFRDEEVAKAASRLYDPNFDRLRLWRWLSGVAMSRGDLDDLTQTQDLTSTESARLAEIICMLGTLLREQRSTRLVLILDEMERLRAIGPESVTTFVSGFTRLVDPNQKSVSILIGASASVETEMIDVFSTNGPVSSRLGADAHIEIQAISDADVDTFIERVIAFIRDENADISALIKAAREVTPESVGERFFPFTDEAIDALKSQLQQLMTPREITIKMTRALGRSYRLDSKVIATDCFA